MGKTQIRGRQICINDITGANMASPIGIFDETKTYNAFDEVIWNGRSYQVKPGITINPTDEGDLSNSPSNSPDNWIKSENIKWYHSKQTGADIKYSNAKKYYLKLDFFYYTPPNITGLDEFTFVFVFKNNTLLTPGTDYKKPNHNYAGTSDYVRESLEIITSFNSSDVFDVYYYEYKNDFVPSLGLTRNDNHPVNNTKIVRRFHYDDNNIIWNGYLDSLSYLTEDNAYSITYKSYNGTYQFTVNKYYANAFEVINIGNFKLSQTNGWCVELWHYGKHKRNKTLGVKYRNVPKQLSASNQFYIGILSYTRGTWKARMRHVTKNIVTEFSEEAIFYRRGSIYKKGNTKDQFLGIVEFIGLF